MPATVGEEHIVLKTLTVPSVNEQQPQCGLLRWNLVRCDSLWAIPLWIGVVALKGEHASRRGELGT